MSESVCAPVRRACRRWMVRRLPMVQLVDVLRLGHRRPPAHHTAREAPTAIHTSVPRTTACRAPQPPQ
eukprot:5346930-Prymnesium_polylepis.1